MKQKFMKPFLTIPLTLIFLILILFRETSLGQSGSGPPEIYSQAEERWVDSIILSLTREEKTAQLFNVRAYSNRDSDHVTAISELVSKYKIGGLTFFQGGPMRQVILTNYYQTLAEVPLMIAMDAEWGLGMRLDSCFSFPYQMTLGAMTTDSTVYDMASEIALQLKRIGVHMNFAPVVDINNNPDNPVIHVRSFGEDRRNVSGKGLAYTKGLMDQGIIATAKHFPGHGDTDTDSHLTLPLIAHPRQRLDSVELYPYRQLIGKGLSGVMVAHLCVPALDSSSNKASTLSEPVVTGLLKEELGFDGLIVTDALDMKGVTLSAGPGDIELKAFLAGNDILLLSTSVPEAIARISEGIEKGNIPDSLLDYKCRKVLHFKYRAGLNRYTPMDPDHLLYDINNGQNLAIERAVYKEAVTLAWNPTGALPVYHPDTLKIASLCLGVGEVTPFQHMLGNYAAMEHWTLPEAPAQPAINKILEQLPGYDLVIIGVHNLPVWKKSMNSEVTALINRIKRTVPVVIDLFGHPYYLDDFADLTNVLGLVVSYQDGEAAQETSAQMIFGSLPFKGRLPVSGSPEFTAGSGITTEANSKIRYTIPEEIGIEVDQLKQVDSIAEQCIRAHVFPGCQILAMKDGEVFYNRCFGYHTYDSLQKVSYGDLYDIASVTKVAATTLAVMKLNQEQRIDIDQMLVTYLPFLAGTDKATLIIREMMAHQSRLFPWIRFYDETMKDGLPDPDCYQPEISEMFPYRVSEGMYIHRDYIYRMFDTIVRSKLLDKPTYKYSDLGFYLLKRIIENVTNLPLDQYVSQSFYEPMDLPTICFRPRERFSLGRIVPTENDQEFRKKLIHGDVHDPGAAMMGGVSGHAGLFSNASDLAVLMQMLLQKGVYNGERYLDSSIVEEFTKQQFPLNDNRRGIGFDKPVGNGSNGPACVSASHKSFGHSGFTGTYVWADPETNLVYIFLSNRVYPDATNSKLIEQGIRTKVHEVFYQAIK
jgi:beta-glucosidase-like glycosyl hydrolase/CubicO group peptidase (beta-lactamase class C family)